MTRTRDALERGWPDFGTRFANEFSDQVVGVRRSARLDSLMTEVAAVRVRLREVRLIRQTLAPANQHDVHFLIRLDDVILALDREQTGLDFEIAALRDQNRRALLAADC